MKTKTQNHFLAKIYIPKRIILFLGLSFGVMASSSAATDYYVSTSGSDSNPGTAASPFRTISKAASVVAAGGTVHVASGSYAGQFQTTVSGTASARIRFVSDTKWGAKIIGSGGSGENLWDNRGNYIDIDGFEFDGTNVTAVTVGIALYGSYDVAKNNLVHHIATTIACSSHGAAGIETDNYFGGAHNDVLSNVVHHVGSNNCGYYQGIYLSTSGTAWNNIVYAISNTGITSWHNATNLNIINNTIFGNGQGITVGGGGYYNGFSGPNDYSHVANNIVFDNSSNGIDEEGSTGTHNVFINNLSYGNGTNWALNSSTHSGDVNANPQFVNYIRAGGGDYHLKNTSPAIDKGTSIYAPTTDLDGNTRPQGAGFDIGAYEYTSNACTAPYAPDPPSNLTAAASSTTQINLTWMDNSAVESAYLVERSMDGITFSQIASLAPNTTSYTNTGLTANTKYYYRVRATNCFGNSTYSVIVNATTKLATNVNEQTTINSIMLYPNPCSTNFTISILSEIILKDAMIKIYDVCGKEVKNVLITNHETIIDRAELQNGIYFYSIINNNEKIANGKLIIQ